MTSKPYSVPLPGSAEEWAEKIAEEVVSPERMVRSAHVSIAAARVLPLLREFAAGLSQDFATADKLRQEMVERNNAAREQAEAQLAEVRAERDTAKRHLLRLIEALDEAQADERVKYARAFLKPEAPAVEGVAVEPCCQALRTDGVVRYCDEHRAKPATPPTDAPEGK